MATTADHRIHDDHTATVAGWVASMLWLLGVRDAYGITGREIVPTWTALLESKRTPFTIETRHMRHENGAGFAALGSWSQTGRPVAIFVTTGPGLTNVLTSIEAARAAGAKIILISPLTPAGERGRGAIQATGPAGYFNPDLYQAGRVFDHVTMVESRSQLPLLAGALAGGCAGAGGFCAHVAIATSVQMEEAEVAPIVPAISRPPLGISPARADDLAERLAEAPFAVWLGAGALRHSGPIRLLLDITGAPAMASPRALGIADRHRSFLGVTGNGGHTSVHAGLAEAGVRRTLVLGSALREATSGWRPELAPPEGFIHVDLDPSVFGRSYPHVPTLGIQADVGEVVNALLMREDRLVYREPPRRRSLLTVEREPRKDGLVHPVALLRAIQRHLVDGSDMPLFADASSAMFHAAHRLTFDVPGRLVIEGTWGAMGFAGAAALGAAAGRGGRAAALVGDGSLHMQDEINAAVRYGIRVIFIVLNDSQMGIVSAGMRATGREPEDTAYPPTDFAAVADAKGAKGIRVTSEDDLDEAFRAACKATGPIVLDVLVDPSVAPPIATRTNR
jgi:acetolactate synthase-1/2/3 large subunit